MLAIMRASLLWLLAAELSNAVSFSTVHFIPSPQSQAALDGSHAVCTNQTIRVRKEWRKLSNEDKLSYLGAVECLHQKPPQTSRYFEGVQNRYDDFVALHVNATNGGIHNVGVFMPWHRLAIWNYETVLRDECGYKGAQPYWDYTLDTPERGGHFKTSPVFDPKYGFGGDGSLTPSPDNKNGNSPKGAKAAKGVKCADGPFAKYKINLGPGNSMKANPRCLTRQINGPMAEAAAKPENLAAIMRESTFEQFQQLRARNAGNFNLASPNSFVVGFHTIGHQGIGGEMRNAWTSTNDPLFWIHHAELDRLWAVWQGGNKTRLHDVAAPERMTFSQLMESSGPRTSQQTMIWMGQFPPSLPIGKIADTQNRDGNGVLCYRYDG